MAGHGGEPRFRLAGNRLRALLFPTLRRRGCRLRPGLRLPRGSCRGAYRRHRRVHAPRGRITPESSKGCPWCGCWRRRTMTPRTDREGANPTWRPKAAGSVPAEATVEKGRCRALGHPSGKQRAGIRGAAADGLSRLAGDAEWEKRRQSPPSGRRIDDDSGGPGVNEIDVRWSNTGDVLAGRASPGLRSAFRCAPPVFSETAAVAARRLGAAPSGIMRQMQGTVQEIVESGAERIDRALDRLLPAPDQEPVSIHQGHEAQRFCRRQAAPSRAVHGIGQNDRRHRPAFPTASKSWAPPSRCCTRIP